MSRDSGRWKTLFGLCVIFALAFVVFGGMRFGYSLKSIISLAFAGVAFGFISAPEIVPKAFTSPTLWQISSSISGCLILAFAMSSPQEGYLLAVVVGLILGFLAPYWVKHIQIP